PAGQVQGKFHVVVQKEETFQAHKNVVPGEINIMVVIPVSGGDVVIVRIDKVFESAIVYLLRPQRAAIPGGANMSPMVVHDRVVVRSQVVVHADHNPLTDFRHERGAQVGLSSGCDGRYVEAPHHRCRPARIDLHRRLTLEELVITGGDSVVVDGNS